MATSYKALAPSPVEIAIDFLKESRPLNDDQRAKLRDLGVPDAAIERDPYGKGGAIRAARVTFDVEYFDFATEDYSDAEPAFLACARDWRGLSSDLVAFDYSGRALRWIGREALLGAHNVLAPRFDEPLRAFPDVWAWLRADRDGVVVFDWRAAAAILEGVTLSADNTAFGQVLRRRLTRAAPPIVVLNHSAAAA